MKTQDGSAVFQTGLGTWTTQSSPHIELKDGAEYVLAFRPEAVVCDAAETAVNLFRGTIVKSAFLGESSYRTVSSGGITLSVNEFSGPERADGSEVPFSVAPDKISILEK